ncbi:SH3 beta-barrel fold-containing protein [Hoylesella timonensis]|uniref:SH3 beta-barrel fold-containing protein n=1 Tax=Hoylesella timonensis TaxID=386414 RepID=UPI001897A3B8|nr:SH3 beta-barrel fold-containing protein [Hoylesella timonensis]
MATTFRNELGNVMSLAWQFVKRNGYTMSEALKCAWANVKLRAELSNRIVKFYFQKVDGTLREAYGTLKTDLIPETKGDERKRNDTVQVYFDTEKSEYRCFKKANLIRIA